jgi:hypothetical protein
VSTERRRPRGADRRGGERRGLTNAGRPTGAGATGAAPTREGAAGEVARPRAAADRLPSSTIPGHPVVLRRRGARPHDVAHGAPRSATEVAAAGDRGAERVLRGLAAHGWPSTWTAGSRLARRGAGGRPSGPAGRARPGVLRRAGRPAACRPVGRCAVRSPVGRGSSPTSRTPGAGRDVPGVDAGPVEPGGCSGRRLRLRRSGHCRRRGREGVLLSSDRTAPGCPACSSTARRCGPVDAALGRGPLRRCPRRRRLRCPASSTTGTTPRPWRSSRRAAARRAQPPACCSWRPSCGACGRPSRRDPDGPAHAALLRGRERTRTEYAALLADAGLRLTAVVAADPTSCAHRSNLRSTVPRRRRSSRRRRAAAV